MARASENISTKENGGARSDTSQAAELPGIHRRGAEPAPFVCTYMGRNRERPFRFIWNHSTATAANVYLLLYPREAVAGTGRERISDVFQRSGNRTGALL